MNCMEQLVTDGSINYALFFLGGQTDSHFEAAMGPDKVTFIVLGASDNKIKPRQ